MKPKLLSLIIASLFAGCGGGGGTSAPPTVAPVLPDEPSRPGLFFTFFGCVDNPAAPMKPGPVTASCATETASFISTIMTGGWGDTASEAGRLAIADKAIRHMQEARDRGVSSAIVMIDFVMLDGAQQYRGPPAHAELVAFLRSIQAAGLADMVTTLYPADEPDVHRMSADSVRAMNADIRAALAQVGMTAKIMVTYGNDGMPGVDTFDLVGVDVYGLGDAVLDLPLATLKAVLRPDQRIVLVPGGAEPWRVDPWPFYARAQIEPQIAGIMAFVWWNDYEPGNFPGAKGIRDAATRCAYEAVGRRIKQAAGAACSKSNPSG
jgi:hypothetical protein